MLIKDVKKLTPEERFFYWIRERHNIYKLREGKKKPAPWTDDEVLQTNFFTNPYRENDKVTVWFRENIRDPMDGTARVLMATVIFRWFNRIETGEVLIKNHLLTNWDSDKAARTLEQYKEDNNCPVFTGAYMIKAGNGPPGCKIRNVCEAIDCVAEHKAELVKLCLSSHSLQEVWKRLKQFPHLGPFMAYEIVCDLRYTYLLEDAGDINTWANPGPGAMRGLARLHNIPVNRKMKTGNLPFSPLHEMQRLLKASYKELKGMPKFELRSVEHSLCEFDKYDRALFGDGKMKRKYNAKGH